MSNFKIFKSEDNLPGHNNLAGNFRILVQNSDFEIFEAVINKGKAIIFQPTESKDSTSLSFVISGKLLYTNTNEYILPGSYYTFSDLTKTHLIRVVEDTKILTIRKKQLLNEQIQEMNKIYELVEKIQKNDNYTMSHCNDTGNLAVQIAINMKLDEDKIKNVMRSGKIHDVGKSYIESTLLNKPNSLTNEEMVIIKNHPKDGYNIIMDILNNSDIATIVLEHHERIDGSGYPNGLLGHELKIESKIIAAADSYDAMTSDRPYKKAKSKEEAIEEMKTLKGIHYDPEVIDVLIDIISSDYYI